MFAELVAELVVVAALAGAMRAWLLAWLAAAQCCARVTGASTTPGRGELRSSSLNVTLSGLTQTNHGLGRFEWAVESATVALLLRHEWCALGERLRALQEAGQDWLAYTDAAFASKFAGKVILAVNPASWPQCGPKLSFFASGAERYWGKLMSCRHALGYIDVFPTGGDKVGFYTHMHPSGGWQEALGPFVSELDACGVMDAFVEDSAQRAVLLALNESHEWRAAFETEPNPYHTAYESVPVVLFAQVLAPALYFGVALQAARAIRQRKSMKVGTPPTIRFALHLNLCMMIVLGTVIALDGYFWRGVLTDSNQMAFRSLLLGCTVASSTLIVSVWSTVLADAAPTAAGKAGCLKAPSPVARAVALVALDATISLMLTRMWFFGSFVSFQLIPFFFWVLELANVIRFYRGAHALLHQMDTLEKAISNMRSPDHDARNRREGQFRRRMGKFVLFAAICSASVLTVLFTASIEFMFYRSPQMHISLALAFVYAKVGVAWAHVSICSPSPRQTPKSTKWSYANGTSSKINPLKALSSSRGTSANDDYESKTNPVSSSCSSRSSIAAAAAATATSSNNTTPPTTSSTTATTSLQGTGLMPITAPTSTIR